MSAHGDAPRRAADDTILPAAADAATQLPSRNAAADATIGGAAPLGDAATMGGGVTFGGPSTGGAAPSPAGLFQPGHKVGTRYTIIKLLGRGGMGAVYQAWDDELQVAVAIKVILSDAGSDPATRHDAEQRFKRELLLARQVTHRNVVRIHDLGDVEGLKYITMSFLEGETLAALLKREGALPVPRALAIARQLAEGLKAAHEVGVIHRDLKPENIMITPDERAVIMDFGIARSASKGSTHTQAGAIIGTLEYMAPEQASGQPVDQRVDVYAMGLILYDMLVGRTRTEGHDSPMTELVGRLTKSPPPPRTLRPEIPEDFDAIVIRAMEPSRDARFAGTAELIDALSTLAADGHRRADAGPAAAAPPAAPSRLPLAAVAAVAVVAMGVAGVLFFRGAEPAAPAAARDPVSVLVADFENRTGDAVFDGVVEQALGLGIESASFVTAYPRRDALRVASGIRPGAVLDEQTARLVAIREGVNLVLTGSVESSGSGYRIVTRALPPGEDQAALYTLEADADGKARVLESVGELAGKVREALGDTTVPSAGPAASETFTAASLEAARAYAAAQELQWAGKIDEAVEQYRKTIGLDAQMGRAYSGLAAQFANLRRDAEAEQNYQQALALIDRMTDREKFRTRGSYYLFARKPNQAIQEFEGLVKAYPADSSGLSNLALARFYQRDMAAALDQGRKASAIFPKNVLRRSNVALFAMYAGQFDTAIAESSEVHKLNPAHLKAFVARALSELALGRPQDAARTYEQLAGTSAAGASFAAAGLADLAQHEGRLGDAIAQLEKGIAADAAAKNTSGAASKRVALAEAHLARGDMAAAVREAQAALALSTSDSIRAGAGLVFAAAGRAADAETEARVLEERLEADPQAYGRLIRAELALATNQARRAVDFAREAQKLADSWPGRVTLGRAYLALGAFTEAYSEFEAALNRKGEATAIFLDDVPSYRVLPPVHYYMGLAQEGLKSPAAAESFKTLLSLKANGDETERLVADARKRAK